MRAILLLARLLACWFIVDGAVTAGIVLAAVFFVVIAVVVTTGGATAVVLTVYLLRSLLSSSLLQASKFMDARKSTLRCCGYCFLQQNSGNLPVVAVLLLSKASSYRYCKVIHCGCNEKNDLHQQHQKHYLLLVALRPSIPAATATATESVKVVLVLLFGPRTTGTAAAIMLTVGSSKQQAARVACQQY